MNWGEIAKNVVLSPAMLNVYAIAAGILLAWAFDNYVNKAWVKELALEIAKAVEKETPEGTPVDRFLDEFIARVEAKKGREPTAGELKTGIDVKNKVIKLDFEKKF
jgi:hypothetical protein